MAPTTPNPTSSSTNQQQTITDDPDLSEIGHYVTTASPPSAIHTSIKCNFISPYSSNNGDVDVVICKSNLLEVRRFASTSSNNNNVGSLADGAPSNTNNSSNDILPLLLTLPINGRILQILPIKYPNSNKDYLFFITEKGMYSLIEYDEMLATNSQDGVENNSNKGKGAPSTTQTTGEHYPIKTHASGSYKSNNSSSSVSSSSTSGSGVNIIAGGTDAECGPQLTIDQYNRCIAIHSYDGYITIIPINLGYDCNSSKRVVPWRRNAIKDNGSGGAGQGSEEGSRKIRGLSNGPLLTPFHLRIEERTIMSISFLNESNSTTSLSSTSSKSKGGIYIPQLVLLHLDSRGYQHVVTHGIDISNQKLVMNGNCKNSSSSMSMGWNNNAGSGSGMKQASSSTSSSMPLVNEQLFVKGVEGGSGKVISVPPSSSKLGGVLVLGQRSITYHSPSNKNQKVSVSCPNGEALLISSCRVLEQPSSGDGKEEDLSSIVRYLLGDENGRIHLLSLIQGSSEEEGAKLLLDTLGTATTSSSMVYLGSGYVFVGSTTGNSQLIKILDEPVEVVGSSNNATGLLGGCGNDDSAMKEDSTTKNNPLVDTTYIQILEEYDNLGPIVDFDLRPCCSDEYDINTSTKVEGSNGKLYHQSLVVTCSGVGKDGTVRLVRNGVGMREHAAVDMEGIKGMWSLRRRYDDVDDSFLVQSFVRETRILGVQSSTEGGDDDEMEEDNNNEEEEESGALAEVTIDGFNSSKSTLFAGNILVGKFDLLLQVVEDGVRLVDSETLALITQWSPFSTDEEGSDDDEDDSPMGFITVASANESGQVIVALRGGALVYLSIEGGGESSPSIRRVRKVTLDREISCIDLNPFGSTSSSTKEDGMDIDTAGRDTKKSQLVAVGLWDDFSVRLLNLGDDPSMVLEQVLHINLGRGNNEASSSSQLASNEDSDDQPGDSGQHMMARSLCLVTMDSQSSSKNSMSSSFDPGNNVDMLLVGLGDGKLISFVVKHEDQASNKWSIHSRKEVSLGTQGVHLIPFRHGSSKTSGSCVLATGDRPTVVYLTGGTAGSNSNAKLNYSTISLTVDEDEEDEEGQAHKNISVNVATPFRSTLLFSSANANSSSLCVADESCLRLGMIDNIQKLHVTSYKLGMTPRRIAYHEAGRVYCVGCIGSDYGGGETNQNNCVRFFDDSTFEELNCITLEPFEQILTIESVLLSINPPTGSARAKLNENSTPESRPFIVLGTAYGYPDEDEPSQGRVLVIECNNNTGGGNLKSDTEDEDDSQLLRQVRQVADLPLTGGIYSIAPFYGGNILVSCGSNTIICQLSLSSLSKEFGGNPGDLVLKQCGSGHHGHIISLYIKSLVSSDKSLQNKRDQKKHLAIVGDIMRSVALVEYFPKHQVIEELARDFNSNFCTDIAMLTNNTYLAAESFTNLFVLQYNPNATTEQARVRLDTVGQYHLGESVNKMIGGSLVMPSNTSSGNIGSRSATGKGSPDKSSSLDGNRKIDITIGSQTLYGTVDGTLGSILGLGGKTFAFLSALQRAMDAIVRPVGDLSHAHYRAWKQEQKTHGSCGFVDGDYIETFLDLSRPNMERVVKEMNINGKWNILDDGKGFRERDESQSSLMDTDEGMDTGSSSVSSGALTVEDVLSVVEDLSQLH